MITTCRTTGRCRQIMQITSPSFRIIHSSKQAACILYLQKHGTAVSGISSFVVEQSSKHIIHSPLSTPTRTFSIAASTILLLVNPLLSNSYQVITRWHGDWHTDIEILLWRRTATRRKEAWTRPCLNSHILCWRDWRTLARDLATCCGEGEHALIITCGVVAHLRIQVGARGGSAAVGFGIRLRPCRWWAGGRLLGEISCYIANRVGPFGSICHT